MKRADTSELMTALLGPDEIERSTHDRSGVRVPEFTFLVHPALKRGERRCLDPKAAAALSGAFGPSFAPDRQFVSSRVRPVTDDGYVDPLLGTRWLAAFAPVGGTGYVVLVQSREDAVVQPSRTLVRRLAVSFLAGLALMLTMFGLFAARAARRYATRLAPDPIRAQNATVQ